MKKLVLLSALLLGSAAFASELQPQGLSGSRRPEKKLICMGWGVPRTVEQWSCSEEIFEKDCPFDGLAFGILMELKRDGKTVWHNTSDRNWRRDLELTEEDFAPWVEVLRKKRFKKLKHNFVAIQSLYFTSDWFNDKLWKRSLENYRQYVRFAKKAGLRGMALDVELYPTADAPFVYRGLSGRTFEETERKVRERGREFAKMLAEEYPDMVLFCYIWSSDSLDPFSCDHLAAQRNINLALLPAFMNGVYDAIPETVKIVDGNEDPGYRAADAADFDRVVANYERYARYWIAPENQKKYRAITSRGLAIYMDAYMDAPSYPIWKTTDNPLRLLQENIARTMESAEEYAWMWEEKGTFWPELYTPELRKKWGLSSMPDWETRLPGVKQAIAYGKDPVTYAKKHALPENLIRNGDLNGEGVDLPDWYFWQAGECVPGKFKVENGRAVLTQVGQGCIAQNIVPASIQLGKRYIFTAKARVHGDQVEPVLGLYMLDKDGKLIRKTRQYAAFGAPGADGCREAAMIFDAPADVKFGTFRVMCNSVGSRFGIPEGNFIEFEEAALRQVVYPWDKDSAGKNTDDPTSNQNKGGKTMKKQMLAPMLLAGALAVAAEAPQGSVLTKNSGLEGEGSKIEGWGVWRARGTAGSVNAGGGIVKIVRAANTVMFQEIDAVQPGEKYIFTVRAKANGDKVTPAMSIQFVDAKDTIIKGSVKRGSFGDPDKDGWRTGRLVFQVPEVKNYALVRIVFGSSGPKEGLTDDDWCEFDEAKLVSASIPGVLTKNSDLDGEGSKIADWRWWRARGDKGQFSAVGGVVRIAQSANSSAFQEIKTLKPGKTYVFTVRARVTGDKVKPTMSIQFVDAADKIIKGSVKRGSFGEPDEDGWRTGEIVFTAPADGNYDLARVLFGSSGSGDIPRGNMCEFDKAELREK